MVSVFRATFYAVCLAAGSWLGVGKPSLEQVRAELTQATNSIETMLHVRVAEPAEEPHARATEDVAPTLRPDLGDVPSMRPWPALNAEASITKAWMVAEGPAYAKGSGRRLVTLTFDDGPSPESTPKVLSVLARHNVHASFFVIGRYLDGDAERAKASRDTLKQVAAAGHLIGNHGYDHVPLTSITHTQVLEQLDQGAASIERVTGKRPLLFRPPYGKLDAYGENAVRERGLDLLLWSVEKQDMKRADAHAIFREVVNQIHYKQGGIVLLHDIRSTSITVLRELLDWLELHAWDPKHPSRRGYEVVDLPTYLREVASSPLPYATRDELERAREATESSRPARHASNLSRRATRLKATDSRKMKVED